MKENLLELIVIKENAIHRANENGIDASSLKEELQDLVSKFNSANEAVESSKSILKG